MFLMMNRMDLQDHWTLLSLHTSSLTLMEFMKSFLQSQSICQSMMSYQLVLKIKIGLWDSLFLYAMCAKFDFNINFTISECPYLLWTSYRFLCHESIKCQHWQFLPNIMHIYLVAKIVLYLFFSLVLPHTRYANVIPVPETRVILKTAKDSPTSEYINANYVRGSRNESKYYIATQVRHCDSIFESA